MVCSLRSVQKLKHTPDIRSLRSGQVFIIEQFRRPIGDLQIVPFAPLMELTLDELPGRNPRS